MMMILCIILCTYCIIIHYVYISYTRIVVYISYIRIVYVYICVCVVVLAVVCYIYVSYLYLCFPYAQQTFVFLLY